MGTFDQQGGLGEKFGQHPTENIPTGLAWEQMGPKIQAELVEKKRRRLLWWWLPSTVLVVMASAYFLLAAKDENIGSFRIPVAVVPARHASDGAVTQQSAQASDQDKQQSNKNRTINPVTSIPEAGIQRAVVGHNSQLADVSKQTLTPLEASHLPAMEPSFTRIPSGEQPDDSLVIWSVSPLIESLLLSPLPIPNTVDWVVKPTVPNAPSATWLLEIEAGRNFNLSAATPSPNIPNAEVTRLAGVSGGIRLGYAIQQTPYTIWTGVSVADFVQRERLDDALAVRLYQPGTVDTIFRNILTGAETFVFTDSVGGTRELRIQQHSTFRSLSIPLMVGRTWGQARWQLAAQTGVDLHLSYWEDSKYLSADYELQDAPSERSIGLAFRLEGQLLLPSSRFGRPFIRGAYRRFLHQPAGLAPGTAFRPQGASLTLGWQVCF